tara:strand:- start:294 stop:401 length:108 start_codon:yes stop_codon:yes gene_type:complete
MGAMACGCSLPAICTAIQYKKLKPRQGKREKKIEK